MPRRRPDRTAWLGQAQVVGDMVAGVILDPSPLGALAPGLQTAVFPPESKPNLFAGVSWLNDNRSQFERIDSLIRSNYSLITDAGK